MDSHRDKAHLVPCSTWSCPFFEATEGGAYLLRNLSSHSEAAGGAAIIVKTCWICHLRFSFTKTEMNI